MIGILAKIPKPMNMEQAHPVTFARTKDGAVNSLGIFIAQEILRFNKLLKVVIGTLNDLQRGIKVPLVPSNGWMLQ